MSFYENIFLIRHSNVMEVAGWALKYDNFSKYSSNPNFHFIGNKNII